MSGSPLCSLWFRDSQGPWYYRQDILSMNAMHPTSSHPRMRACSPYPIHPDGPLVFIGNDTKWPLHHHQHIHTHKYAPMLREKIGWSNSWTPTQRFMAHWKQQGQRKRGRDMLSLMAREGVLFINIWESILACNKTARSISDCYSPPFCSINVSSWTS